MSGDDSTFEEKVEAYRQRINQLEELSEPTYLDLRGSMRSIGTLSSVGKNSSLLQPELMAESRSRVMSVSPTRDVRKVQSAVDYFGDERGSMGSWRGVMSPQGDDKNLLGRQLVSDYVAFGRDRVMSPPANEGIPLPRRPENASFSLQTDQNSSCVESASEKIARLEMQLSQKTEALRVMAKEHESMRNALLESQSLLRTLESSKTEAEMQLHDAQREIKSTESHYKAIIRKLESSLPKEDLRPTHHKQHDDDLDTATARDQLTAKTAECHGLKKERLRLLKELEDSKRKEAALAKKLKTEHHEKDRLTTQIKELDLLVQVAEDREGVKESVENLKRENESLRKELHDRHESLSRKDVKLASPHSNTPKTKSTRPHSIRKRGNSGSNHCVRAEGTGTSKHHCSSNYRRVTHELMDLLGVCSYTDLLVGFKRVLASEKHMREFVCRTTEIVVANSPPGSFSQPPTLEQVGNWLERLVEEYLGLRKGANQNLYTDVLSELRARLGVAHCSEIPAVVDSIVVENRELRDRVRKPTGER